MFRSITGVRYLHKSNIVVISTSNSLEPLAFISSFYSAQCFVTIEPKRKSAVFHCVDWRVLSPQGGKNNFYLTVGDVFLIPPSKHKRETPICRFFSYLFLSLFWLIDNVGAFQFSNSSNQAVVFSGPCDRIYIGCLPILPSFSSTFNGDDRESHQSM